MIPKLFQWLIAAVLFMSVWLALLMDYVSTDFSKSYRDVVLYLPIYLLIAFACYSLAVVGYRVATFNDCVEAAEELKQQIEEAKADLKSKGLKMD